MLNFLVTAWDESYPIRVDIILVGTHSKIFVDSYLYTRNYGYMKWVS